MRRKLIVATLSGFLIVTSLVSIPVHAQTVNPPDRTTVEVVPTVVDVSLTPGTKQERKLTVTNKSNAPVTFVAEARKTIINERVDPGVRERYDASSWVTTNPGQFTLEAKQSTQISVIVEAPNDASPGGHYATIRIRPIRPDGDDSTSFISGGAGIQLLAVVPGEMREQLVIGKFDVNTLNTGKPIVISVPITNKGTVHELPQGVMSIYGRNRNLVSTATFGQSDGGLIYPGTTRLFRVAWNPKKSGRYVAKVVLTYGITRHIADKESPHIWYASVSLLVVGVLLILIVISVAVILLRRRFANPRKT